jgi:hypothetical protein
VNKTRNDTYARMRGEPWKKRVFARSLQGLCINERNAAILAGISAGLSHPVEECEALLKTYKPSPGAR